MSNYRWRGKPDLGDLSKSIEDEKAKNPRPPQAGNITYFSWPMPPPDPPGHGSWPRYRMHLAAGEEPCQRCAKWVEAHPEAPPRLGPRSQQDRQRGAS